MGVEHWAVESKDSTAQLNSLQLLELLMAKLMQEERQDQVTLSETLVEYLERGAALKGMTPTQVAFTGFSVGYWYRVFREKNKVQYVQSSTTDDQPEGD